MTAPGRDGRRPAPLEQRRPEQRPVPQPARRHDRRLRDHEPPRPDHGQPDDRRLDAPGPSCSSAGASSSRATPRGRSAFGADGMLYVSGGEGASFNGGAQDYGQKGGTLPDTPVTPMNPCGDPPGRSAGR